MISGTEVFAKLLNDPKVATVPEPVLGVLRPLVEHLPELLADELDQPLSLGTLMAAKLKFLRHAMEKDYARNAVQAMPEESLGFMDRDTMAEMLQGTLEQLIPMMEELAGAVDMEELLAAHGVTEEQVMLGPKTGLSPKVLALYRKGTATIGDVLRLQPGLIVNNTD